MSTYFIGDNHFYDENIMKFENRPFSTVEEMNTFMVNSWNRTISPNDTVIVVGDFFDLNNCTGPEASAIIEKLNGNIILIIGNHDKQFIDFYRSCHSDKIEVIEYPIIYKDFWMISHEPMYVNENMPYANIFAHVHNNPMYKTVSSRSYCVSAERLNYVPILDSAIMLAVKEFKE